jgi:CHAD domain-containing protein
MTPPPSPTTTPPAPDAEFPLLAYADGLMEELRRHVPEALKQWDEEAIHQARVATRRLKALIDLMKPVLGKDRRRPLAKVMRRLRRRLGPLRDADVMLGHLKELGEGKAARDKFGAAINWLAGQTTCQRDALRDESARDTKGSAVRVLAKLGAWYPVREQVAEAREAVDLLLAESLHLQADAFAEQADRLVAAAERRHLGDGDDEHHPAPADGNGSAAPSAPAPPQAHPHQDPHALRIAGKALRYTLEMAAAEGHALPGKLPKTFKRMQEFLGLWHDYVVLADQAMHHSLDAQLSHHDPRRQEQIFDLARVALRHSAREMDAFLKLWSTRGEEITRAIRASFPLTRPPAEPAPTDPAPVPPPELVLR